MTKINQIQTALRELSGGSFQKLADAYLYKKGYKSINPRGSVTGADKTKTGTPDTFITLPNGTYVFVEYTTQQTGVCKKHKDDLDKCFNEEKTGVPVEKIEEVIFCHTSSLSTDCENDLVEVCQNNGVNLNIFGIGQISFDLYQKYPGLARDFLGIEVDTGQIVPSEEFVATYNKSKHVTRLDTAFHFRDDVAEEVLQGLEEGDLVIVSGRPGIGKSRLALECCKRFKDAHLGYEVRCISNRGPDLFEDLRVHFSEPGYFLILVDDANHISRFEYIVQLLQDQRDDQQIKVIVTVRDYALDKVREVAHPLGSESVVELQLLEETQIKQLVKDEYGILNQCYLDRIADIARGNPRLAIMAADVANHENTLESIHDVTALYEEYFASIKRDLKNFVNINLLKAAGIVAFFRAVDRTNEEIMSAIEEAFKISSEAFWEAARRLHDQEMLDIYEDEVVRTSDQVLSTYLFYLAFFKKRALDFSALLDYFFPRLSHRLVDAINPVLDAFDSDAIIQAMRPHVDRIWTSMEESDDDEALLHLMNVFWFTKPTDTLQYINNRIEEMEVKSVDLSNLEFKASSSVPSPSILSVLSSFKYADDNTFQTALSLLFGYLAKQPEELPQVLHILTDGFGFKHTSHIRGFTIQRAVIDVLWKRALNGENELYSKLFLAVAEKYLYTRFHTTEPKGRRTFITFNFQLPATPELFELRRIIWNRLFQLYQTSALREGVLDVLQTYSTSAYFDPVNDIVAQDAAEVLSFIDLELDPSRYGHCITAHNYLDLMDHCEVSFDRDLRDRFTNEAYNLSRVLLSDWLEIDDLDLDREEYEQLKKKQIEEHFESFSFAEYEQFFEICLEIKADLDQEDDKEYRLQSGVVDVLLALSNCDPDLYAEVLEHYIELGDPLNLNSEHLVKRFVDINGIERAYEILSRPGYPTKRVWLFNYYTSLSQNKVTDGRLGQLYSLYREAQLTELPHGFDFLLKYRPLDDEVVARVTEIILEKTKTNLGSANPLLMLFKPHTNVNKAIIDLFANDIDLLKQAYLKVLKTERYRDHKRQTFTRILDIDPDFILGISHKITYQ